MTECWLWAGTINHAGYGHLSPNGKTQMAHRVMYESEIGAIPQGLTLDHLCRVRSCINPEHMEIVTLKENILRGTSPAALHAQQTHCANGHEYNEENTRWQKSRTGQPYRRCITCQRKQANAHYARKRVAA